MTAEDKAMKPLGICINLLSQKRTGPGDGMDFTDYLKKNGIPYESIDCYSSDIISKLSDYSGIFWWYSHYVVADKTEAQHILDIASKMGLKVYPDHNTAWHFDDKIAEMYAFQSVNAPIPKSWVFYRQKECEEWLKNEAAYPIVGKLKNGSGSTNVKILRDKKQALAYCKRMFSKGYDSSPSLIYKTYSKVQSTRDWKTFVSRFKKIPNFLKARSHAKRLGRECDYCYFQEFVENDGYDLKVAVVGDKLGYFARHTRKADFRASGSGDFYYDRDLMTEQIIKDAFRVADALGVQCMGFDFVVDKKTGQGLIIEMCHGFDQHAVYEAGGYFDRECIWHSEPLNVSEEIVKNMYRDFVCKG